MFVESGGDNLAATFSPELSDLTLSMIDVVVRFLIERGMAGTAAVSQGRVRFGASTGASHQSGWSTGCG